MAMFQTKNNVTGKNEEWAEEAHTELKELKAGYAAKGIILV